MVGSQSDGGNEGRDMGSLEQKRLQNLSPWEQTEESFLVQSLIPPDTVLDHRQYNSSRTSQDQPGLNRGFREISRQAWTLELVRKGRKQEVQLCGGGCLVAKSYLTLCDPWTVVIRAPLSVGFSRQYWRGLPSPGESS